jgi:periplasmic divalent cation tolerance protein
MAYRQPRAPAVPAPAKPCYENRVRLVLCNCPPDRADEIARRLVEQGLAACVSRAPVTSTYRWKGELCVDPEVQLTIKVAAERVPALTEALRAMHPYEVPEIVVVPVDTEASLAAYVKWVREGS